MWELPFYKTPTTLSLSKIQFGEFCFKRLLVHSLHFWSYDVQLIRKLLQFVFLKSHTLDNNRTHLLSFLHIYPNQMKSSVLKTDYIPKSFAAHQSRWRIKPIVDQWMNVKGNVETHMHAHTCVHMHANMHKCTHTHTHTHTGACNTYHPHIHHVHICIHECTSIHVCWCHSIF